MPTPDHIQDVLNELAATATYLQESGRLMRESTARLIEAEERIVKNNLSMSLVIERIEKAMSAALRARDERDPNAGV